MSRKIGNRSQPLNDSHKKDNLRALVNGYLFFLLKIAKVLIIPSLLLPSVLISEFQIIPFFSSQILLTLKIPETL